MNNFENIIDLIRTKYTQKKDYISLHEPVFSGNEKKYLNEAIDSTFVSSVGSFVNKFEAMVCEYTGSEYAIATVNGTNALYISLILSGVLAEDEVICQSLSFVAGVNAASYIGANPIFIDIDKDTLGMSPDSLLNYLTNNATIKKDGFCYNKISGKRIKACVPMHTFGLPCRIDEIKIICDKFNIILVEDAAESIGSFYKQKHTGTFGKFGIFSFNGNKTITCGGGGVIITDDKSLAKRAKHITSQAKIQHKWEFDHDEIGYNFRMPNINAALACAQMEQLNSFIKNKRKLSEEYFLFFKTIGITKIQEIDNAKSNYWLNAIVFSNLSERNSFLEFSHKNKVLCRPSWKLMHKLNLFKHNLKSDLTNSEWFSDRIVNIPSSITI